MALDTVMPGPANQSPAKPIPTLLGSALSAAPRLSGRNRFCSSCNHTYRSVSGELLAYRIVAVPDTTCAAVSSEARMT